MFLSSKKSGLKEILENAQEKGYAIGQFNFSTLEQLQGIALAAKELNMPVICGTSEGEASFFGIEEAALVAKKIAKREGVKMFLNLDHGKNLKIIKRAVDAGYDMVHFDGSRISFEDNERTAKQVVSFARKKGVVVEGELSQIRGSSVVSQEDLSEVTLTSLSKVAKFISSTKIDCIALDVGNVHGIHAKTPRLHLERINELREDVSSLIVLHGGSGINELEIKDAVRRGVVKININTELRLVWKKTMEKYFTENPEEIVPYKILPSVRDEIYKKVKEKIKIFKGE